MLLAVLLVAGLLATGTATAQKLSEGPLFEATSDRGTVHLFGTVHFGLAEFYPLSPRVYGALDASSALLVEADVANVEQAVAVKLMAMMALPTGEQLDVKLGEALWARTAAVAERNGMPSESFLALRPWSVATLLGVLPFQRMGLSPELGVDAHLIAAADERDIPVVELESVEMQLGIFEALSESDERQLLSMTLALLERDEAQEMAEETVAAWQAGDGDAIDRAVNDPMRRDAPALATQLLDDRNRRMLTNALEVLENSDRKTVMVVVGAAHLPGTNGLVDLLRRKGFAIAQR